MGKKSKGRRFGTKVVRRQRNMSNARKDALGKDHAARELAAAQERDRIAATDSGKYRY